MYGTGSNNGTPYSVSQKSSCTATPVGSRPSTKASTKSTKSESRPDSVAPEEVEYMIDRRDELLEELERTNQELQKILKGSRDPKEIEIPHNKDPYNRVRTYMGDIHGKDSYQVKHLTENLRVQPDYKSISHTNFCTPPPQDIVMVPFTRSGLLTSYMDESIRKHVNTKATGHN